MAEVPSRDERARGPAESSSDVALIHGITPDGGLQLIRRRGERVELGAVRPLREGVPLHGEVVSLKPRQECPLLCDVEVLVATPAPAPSAEREGVTRKGPAKVTNDAYRENWDRIWRRSPKTELPS